MKIQFFSDIHLEFGELALPATEADLIVAAGDIGIGVAGVDWLLGAGKPVLYIAGNHEFYGGDLVYTTAAIEAAAHATNVHFLHNSEWDFGGVRFLGTTLWTDFLAADADTMALAARYINDFQQIQYAGRPLAPEDIVATHDRARAWLAAALGRPYSGPTVVVSHHAPSFQSWHENDVSFFRAAYCSDLSALTAAHPIDMWLHGHIHAVSDYRLDGIHVLCNPRGYEGYQVVAGFDPGKLLTL